MSSDEAQLVDYARQLGDQLRADLPAWVVRSVASRTSMDLSNAAQEAGLEAAAVVGDELDVLLARDIDEQRSTPLALLRGAVRFPTAVLAAADVPEVARDDFSRQSFPDDRYDLTPASFADISPAAQDAGIRWGAAKAHVHLSRRRQAGQR